MTYEQKVALSALFAVVQGLLIVLLIIRCIREYRTRQSSDISHFVSLPPIVFLVGAVAGIIVSVPVSVPFLLKLPVAAWCVCEFFVLVSMAMMSAYVFETITYDGVGFEKRNFLGKKTRYEYKNITGISSPVAADVIIYVGRKRIRIDSMSYGGSDFAEYVSEVYSAWYERDIPIIEPKCDPMKGNIENPWVHFVLFLIGILGGVFLAVIAVIAMGKKGDHLATILLLIFGIAGSAGCVLGIFVGRYPERFPAGMRDLFYKKDTWTSNKKSLFANDKQNNTKE